MKKKIVILILSIFLLSAPLVGLWRVPQAFATSHDPILIDGNSDFVVEDNGVVSGSGTEGDPYVIENWDISATATAGITINNTNVFFVVRNCSVANGNGDYNGIWFDNVTNGRIEDCILKNNLYYGIVLEGSTYNTITDNECYSCGYGIGDFGPGNNIINGNRVHNSGWGLRLAYVSNNTVAGNIVYDNGGGIDLSYANDCILADNLVTNCSSQACITVVFSSFNTFVGNTVLNSTYWGFRSMYSNNNIFSNNTVSYNGENGILFEEPSSNNQLIGNTVSFNTVNGFFQAVGSVNNTVNFCSIHDNGLRGLYSGAELINATYNWWGDPSGPNVDNSSTPGTGDVVVSNSTVLYIPWLTAPPGSEPALTPHDPILIESNLDFNSTNGVVSGSGTQFDPFVIENWVISTTSADKIAIYDTDVFFVIRNCLLVDDSFTYNWEGIYLSNVTNGRIENNTCSGNYDGIYLNVGCSNNIVTGNTLSSNDLGIYLDSSFNNTVTGNTISNSNYLGIELSHSSFNDLSSNNVSYSGGDGILLYTSCNNNTLTGNILSDIDGYCISLEFSANCTLIDNDFFCADTNGIYFDHMVNVQVEGNTISDSYEGIYSQYSSNIAVTDNNFTNCYWTIDFEYSSSSITINGNNVVGGHYGIYLYDASFAAVAGNTVTDNTFGIYPEGADNIGITANTIANNTYGVYSGYSENVTIRDCFIQNNTLYGVSNGDSELVYEVDAVNNWWGSVDGPSGEGPGDGDRVSTNVLYNPWLTSPPIFGQVSHSPIVIYNDFEFTSENGVVSGTGTEVDPYVIKNWIISAASSHGIIIQDTTAFFTIRNCVIANGSSSYYGIYLFNVFNGKIENNTCSNNDDGLHILYCSNITVTRNTFSFSDSSGIYMYNSSINTITLNTLTDNTGNGILAHGSTNNFISGNTHAYSYNGLAFSSSDDNTIADNIFTNNEVGLYIDRSSFNNYSDNIVTNNSYEALDLYSSNNSLFSGNTFSNTTEYGIYVYGCSNNTFTDNTVTFNGFGFEIDDSTNHTITGCRIYGNAEFGVINYESDPTYVVDARSNWWGSVDGPSGVGLGSGDAVSANVLYDPWLTGFSHEPILIIGNSEFTYENGVLSGTGTEGDPYVIENWVISAESSEGIAILSTNAFFVIRNCVVNGTGSYQGLHMTNVANGRVEESTFVVNDIGIFLQSCSNIICESNTGNNNSLGIYLYSSSNNAIINSTFIYNDCGIYLNYDSNFVNVINNNASHNQYQGIRLDDASNDAITGNTLTNNGNGGPSGGIQLSGSSNITVSNNIVSYNWEGISLSTCSDVTIANNIVSDSFNGKGIYLVESSFNTLTGNTVTNSSSEGISLYYSSSSNSVSNNIVADNVNSGLAVFQSSNNTLIYNTCLNNDEGIDVTESDNTNLMTNTITGNVYGVYIESSENVMITYCFIQNNTVYGVINYNIESAYEVDARYNWWGSPNGPSGVGPGSGDIVTANVLYNPWLIGPYPVLSFDFGSLGSPVQAGYIQVLNTTAYSPSLGYGWSSTDNLVSRDRGDSDDLRRDFVFGNQTAGTFDVDLTNGEYQVTVVMGDLSYAHDLIDVYAEGIPAINDLTVAAGSFQEVTFNVTITDGQLNLSFIDDGGSDPNWVLNALRISESFAFSLPSEAQFDFGGSSSPLETGYTQVQISSSYSALTGYGWTSTAGLDFRDRSGPDDLRRDLVFSSAEATFNVDLQNGDYLVTVVIGDQDFSHDMIDIYAEGILVADDLTIASGTFMEVSFRSTVSDRQLNLMFHDDGGIDPNWVVTALSVTVAPPLPTEAQFDFGSAGSPEETDYTQVLTSSVYSAVTGYGWSNTAGLDSRDRGAPNDLNGDFVFGSTEHTFNVDLANGNYQITITIGDQNFSHDNIDVYAEELPAINDLTTSAGSFQQVPFSVTITDGQLNLRILDDGGTDPYWVLNAMTIQSI